MKTFDSNIWIAYFHEGDSQHKKALELFKSSKYPIAISEYVIVETCNILLSKATKKIADLFLQFVLDNEDIVLFLSDESLFSETVSCFRSTEGKNLSFVDISLLCLSKECEIVTFDRKLNQELKKKFNF